MRGTRLACAALMMVSAYSWAELSVQAIDPQTVDAEFGELIELGEGDLLLRMRGWHRPEPASGALPEPWNSLYVLGKDGRVEEFVELPSGYDYHFVVPYRSGFAAQRYATHSCALRCDADRQEPAQIVFFEHPTDADPIVLYEAGESFLSSVLRGAPDGQDLYVMETGPGYRLTRIDAQGRAAWQKTTELIEPEVFLATDDGVAFARYAGWQDATLILRALDRDGRQKWETPLTFRVSQNALFSPAGFITLAANHGPAQDRDKPRLVNVDSRTGRITSDMLVEPYAHAVGTADGVLLSGHMLGQAYVGIVAFDGTYSWLRRYVPDQQISDIQRATLTRERKLMLITRERVPMTVTPAVSVVVTDSTAASLANERGRCLASAWREAVALTSQLQTRGLFVAPPRAEGGVKGDVACSNREAQYITFMRDLVSELPAAVDPQLDPRRSIAVRVEPAGQPVRMESYSADRSGYPGAGVHLSFASPYDRAGDFWKILATEIQPHLEQMRMLHERFAQLTGFRYVVSDHSGASYGQVLASLEQAARTANDRIATIPQERLVEIRRHPPIGDGQILLRQDGFGPGENALYPVRAADRTFLEIVEQHRRAVARGEISIRD